MSAETADRSANRPAPPRQPVGRGVLLGPLGLGTAGLGNLYRPVSDEAARRCVDAAWDGGIRYLDTAPHYGLGLAERRVGVALADRPREQYVLSTKVGRLLRPNPAPAGSDLDVGGFAVPDALHRVTDYSADGVRRSLEESLARLGLDRVDVVYVHDPDDPADLDTAIRSGIPALARWRDEGVVGAVGAGMNFVAPLRRIVAESDVDVVMIAGRWTLLDRSAAPLLDDCLRRGVGAVAAAPFNSGLLSRPEPPDDAHFDYRIAPPEVLAAARRYARACTEAGTVLPHAALHFPLRHPAVVSVVAGFSNEAHVGTALEWLGRPVPDGLFEHLG